VLSFIISYCMYFNLETVIGQWIHVPNLETVKGQWLHVPNLETVK